MLGLALLALHLTVSGAELPTLPGNEPPEVVELTADWLNYEHPTGRLQARGHVVLRAGTQVVRADELTYQRDTGVAEAHGNVLLVSGTLVGFAHHLTVDTTTRSLSADQALFVHKRGVDPTSLLTLETRPALVAAGQNAFSFSARRFRILEDGSYEVEGLSFHPCDCNVLEPTWGVAAASSHVRPEERASFTSPTVRIFGVPVLWLPWISLPLTSRASGLLFPEVAFSGLSGVQVDQPLFLTLGRSYDLTLTPGYAFGREATPPGTGFGMRGPRLATELRYAPAEGTTGRAWARILYDTLPERDVLNPNLLLPEARTRGLRGWGLLEHQQALGRGWHQRTDAALYSDGYLFADTTPNGLARSTYFVPSTASLYHRGEDHWAGAVLGFRQDVRWGFPLLGDALGADGQPLPRPPVFQQLPLLLYALPERPLWGPVAGSLRAEFSRLSPLGTLLGDEGTDGVFWPLRPEADGTQGNGVLDPGERQARTRLELRPRLSASLDVGGVLRLAPYLAVRESLYLYEVEGAFRHRGYLLAGVQAETELARTFGTAQGAVRHTLIPSVELRAVPQPWGEREPPVYEAVDIAVPPEGLVQGLLTLRQRLTSRSGAELLRLDVQQGVDFLVPRLGETSWLFRGTLGTVSAEAIGRLDLSTPGLQERLTQLAASLRWAPTPNSSLFATYERARGSSERVRRPIDALLPPPLPVQAAPTPVAGERCSEPALNASPVDQIVAGGNVRFPFGLGADYSAVVQRRDPADCDRVRVFTQQLGLSYTPACNCWQVNVYGRLLAVEPFFDYGFTVTLAGMSFGR